jgi:LETM1 and EF-hand domain-containing protein 1, mitochondrial
MLPRQFQEKEHEETNMKNKLKAQINLAKFLQDTVSLMATDLKKDSNKEIQSTAEDLKKFIDQVRDGKPVSNDDIIKFAKLFSDEITVNFKFFFKIFINS